MNGYGIQNEKFDVNNLAYQPWNRMKYQFSGAFFELVFYILSINFLIQFIFWGSLIMVLKLIESPEIFGLNVIFRVCWTRSENNLKVTFEKM